MPPLFKWQEIGQDVCCWPIQKKAAIGSSKTETLWWETSTCLLLEEETGRKETARS